MMYTITYHSNVSQNGSSEIKNDQQYALRTKHCGKWLATACVLLVDQMILVYIMSNSFTVKCYLIKRKSGHLPSHMFTTNEQVNKGLYFVVPLQAVKSRINQEREMSTYCKSSC